MKKLTDCMPDGPGTPDITIFVRGSPSCKESSPSCKDDMASYPMPLMLESDKCGKSSNSSLGSWSSSFMSGG